MATATLHQGNPLMVDYTPSADVAAGDVILIGAIPYVAHRPIPANTLGAVAARGGVYRGLSAGNYAPGQKVYIDITAKKFTQAVGEHPHFGFIVPSSDPTGDNSEIIVEHAPDGTATAGE